MSNYEILGLNRGATLKEIKAKFRELAKVNHPDKGGDADKFVILNNAYEALLRGDIGETVRQVYTKQQSKTATYRFEGIKKDSKGYLISFFIDGVDNIEIYGKDFNKIGYYSVRGYTKTVNLTVTFEDAKKAKYVFECWLHDGIGRSAKVTYKVTPPPTSMFNRIKNFFK